MRGKKQNVHLWAVAFWLIVWQLAAMALHAAYPHGALLLPSPVSSLARLISLAGTAVFWCAIGTSSMHILGGFLLSCALAVVLAALSARFSRVEELLAPLVAAVKTVPVASFIILALIWLSSRTLPLFIAALMVFPPVYLNVLEGIRRTDASLLEMVRVFRVPFSRTLRGVYLPQVLPTSAPPSVRRWAFAGRPAPRRRSSPSPAARSVRSSTTRRYTSRPPTSSPGRRRSC